MTSSTIQDAINETDTQFNDDPQEVLRNNLNSQINYTGHAAGLTTEVAAGLALDAKTQWMLGAGPWGWLGYGAINAAGGATANIAAQKLRGEEELNWGEVISSGLLGIIPFTSLRFGKKATKLIGRPGTFQRAAIGGAGMGASDRFIQSGFNEGELPSAGEVATGALAGGVFGGGFQQGGKLIVTKHLKNQIIKAQNEGDTERLAKLVFNFRKAQNTSPELDEFVSYEDYITRRSVIKNKLTKSIDGQGELNLPDPNQPIFKGRFENVNELDRAEAALVQNRRGTVRGKGFQQFAKESTEDMKRVYRAMASGELNAHHSNILKSGISLHEGRDEVESMLIETWLVEDGIFSGDNPFNNHNIPEQVHGLTHKWLNERVGKEYLTKLIGPVGSPLRRRWEQLPIDHPDVKSVVKQYAAYVNGATQRTAELMRAYNAIWGNVSKISEDSLDIIYKRLGINELEYDQLTKPGLSKKDARFYNQAYGREKFRITWADGKNESIRERLYREVSEDPKLLAQIDALHEPQPKVQDFSNEPDSPVERPLILQERERWQEELDDLYADRRKRRLNKGEKDRVKALEELLHYGRKNPLFNLLNKK
jgi:hypothetical protein